MEELKWFAVYTRPGWERKVAKLLTKKKITSYCPLNKVQCLWSERRKLRYEPLFASYVFVHLNHRDDYRLVLQTAGVINFVHWLDRPVIIRDKEIDALRHFLNEYTGVTLEKNPVNFNDEVSMINGPLIVRKGNVLEIRNNTVKTILPSLGYTLVAKVRKDNIDSLTYFEESKLKV